MSSSRESFVHRAAREPTVHFALLAALLFAIGAVATSVRRPVVEIDARFVELRVRLLERSQGAPLSVSERQQAEAAYIDEQILASEARARGLDDDERIRAILHQKMLHVLAGDVPQPTDQQLHDYFAQNRARYAGRPAVTVEEVVVPQRTTPTARPVRLDDDANDPGRVLRKAVLTRVTEGELAWSFGDETAARLMGATIGTWVGPHASTDGEHWFRVIARSDATDAPTLDANRDQVRYDWMAQAEDAIVRQRVAEIRHRYSVRVTKSGAAP